MVRTSPQLFFYAEMLTKRGRSLSQYPRITFNAHNFISMFTACDADSLFLLDCFIHTRITSKWKRDYGNTEIIARAEKMQDPDGRPMEHDGDFTESMADNLQNFIDQIGEGGFFEKFEQMISIPEIMKYGKTIYSNPQRVWLDRTKFKGEKVVKRLKFDPEAVREDGQLEFFAV